MDPIDPIHKLLDAFFSERMFTAIVLGLFVLWFIRRDGKRDDKLQVMQDKWDTKLDKIREDERVEREKRFQELKQIVHADNGVIGTNSLSLQAASVAINGLADKIAEQTDKLDELVKK